MDRDILVGGLEHVLFFHIFGIIIPIDFHIFRRGRYTTNQITIEHGGFNGILMVILNCDLMDFHLIMIG